MNTTVTIDWRVTTHTSEYYIWTGLTKERLLHYIPTKGVVYAYRLPKGVTSETGATESDFKAYHIHWLELVDRAWIQTFILRMAIRHKHTRAWSHSKSHNKCCHYWHSVLVSTRDRLWSDGLWNSKGLGSYCTTAPAGGVVSTTWWIS